MTNPSPESHAALERQLKTRTAELANARAKQTAIAIDNARLLNESQESLEQQTATAEILRIISESPKETQPVFQAITDKAETMCNANSAVTTRFDGEMLHLMANTFGSNAGKTHIDGETVDATTHTEALDRLFDMFPIKLGQNSHNARAVLQRRSINISDVLDDVQLAAKLKKAHQAVGTRSSLVVVPMLRGDDVLGAIMVTRAEPGLFPDRLVTLLETFAAQAVIAIENVRLFEETQQALEQQTAISDVLRMITESPSEVEPVLETIADHAADLCEAASASIFLAEGTKLRHVTSRGIGAEHAMEANLIPIDRTSTAGRAVLDGTTVQVEDMQAEADEFPSGHAIAHRLGHRTIAVAPLLRGGKSFGAILLRRMEVRPFSDRQLTLLRTFGDQAAIALENVRLFNETKEALEHQTATADVLGAIASSVADSTTVFDKILDSCGRLFNVDRCSILLINEDGLVEVGAIHGLEAEAIRSLFPLPLSETGVEVALSEQRLIHYPDFSEAPDRPSRLVDLYERFGNFSAVIAPMFWEGRAIGTISVMRFPAQAFSEKEISLLKTFADQAVIAIENARLFQEIENKNQQLEIANRHKSEFLANMSHELRTPLNAIIGFSEVLIERMFGELNDKQEDYLKDIYSSGKHLLALINDILDLSKIEAGHMELKLEEFDIEQALPIP